MHDPPPYSNIHTLANNAYSNIHTLACIHPVENIEFSSFKNCRTSYFRIHALAFAAYIRFRALKNGEYSNIHTVANNTCCSILEIVLKYFAILALLFHEFEFPHIEYPLTRIRGADSLHTWVEHSAEKEQCRAHAHLLCLKYGVESQFSHSRVQARYSFNRELITFYFVSNDFHLHVLSCIF